MTEIERSDDLLDDNDDSSMGGERTPRMVLEISRGRTRYPHRPISGPRFFIGSGAGCDLRLGGDTFPAIHSVIQTLPNGIWFEALATDPPAGINGEVTQGEWLRDGDRIALGSFEFVARILTRLPPATASISGELLATELSDEQITASEIADRLADEMQFVEQFEQSRAAGAHALLEAMKRRVPMPATSQIAPRVPLLHRESLSVPQSKQPASVSEIAQQQFQQDLDRLCQDLGRLTAMIDRRSDTVLKREQQFVEAAESLLAAQRDVANQLETAIEAAAKLKPSEVPTKPSIRFSA